MWSLIIFTVLRIANYSPCMGYRRFSSVIIHNPTSVSQYFSEAAHTENKLRTEFAQWSLEEIKKNCFHALVDGALFIISDQPEVDHTLDGHNFDRRRFHTQLHISFLLQEGDWKLSSTDAASQKVTTALGAPTHFCTPVDGDTDQEYFAIASALQHDTLFLLVQNSIDSKHKTIALVEPIPTFNLQAIRRRDIEAVYLTGNVLPDDEEERQKTEQESEEDDFSFEDSFEDDDHNHRVCELDEFRKHRLCATVYVAWMQFNNDMYRDINYIMRPGNACLRKEKILLTEKVPTKIMEADLLPCSIQTNSLNSQFFVANDHFINDSAFVLEAVLANDESTLSKESVEDRILGYKLVLHLHNVLSLRKTEEEGQR